ncbi:MAG: 3-hydroxyacyl-CoA dehydrogenase NAD-binding domain-containing protein, partial [Pseudomonadota bacterium]
MTSTTYELHGGTAVIALVNPPVNSLSHDVRLGIVGGIDRANADPAVHAIVLIGTERAFSGGADIHEFRSGLSRAEPNLPTVIRIVEDSPKPVIAAIGGICMGGGLELALGAHFRIAKPDASIALPEVKLGLLPGAGGTQRLPRLVGVEAAANFIVSGNPLAAERFTGTALFEEIAGGDLLESALAFAGRVAAGSPARQRVRDLVVDYPDHQAYFQFARNMIRGVAGAFPAPLKCIEAVEAAATLPFDEGLQLERRLFMELMLSPESRALRHAFEGERAASKIPDVPPETPTRPIARVGVIGAGTMGGGISMNFLNAGLPVTLLEVTQQALDNGIAVIRRNYEASVRKGKLAPEALERRMALLTGTLSYEDLEPCDLVIEAVFEELSVKEAVFRRLDAVAKLGAILATNTSTLDVDRIARFTSRPADVVGMHFFSPANVMKLLEVVRGAATAKDVLATVMQLAKKIRKTAVVSGVCDGFIGNRMIGKYGHQAGVLMVAGATPWQVDRALEKWGMAMGPFRMSDLAGNDIGWAIRKREYVDRPPVIPNLADRLCELGRFGQKTGKGWYLYQPGNRHAIPDPEVERMIVDYRSELGITPRRVSDEEIVQRCVYALVNEGARILEEGIAARASDIDMIYLTGYGFPLHRGGPMRYADEVGLYNVARTMREFAAGGESFWEPAPLIARLAADGASLT